MRLAKCLGVELLAGGGRTVWCRSKDNTAGAKPAWSLMIVLRSSFLLSAKDLLFSAPHHTDLRQTALKSHLFRRLNDLIACRLRRCLCRHCSSRRGRDANPSVPGALRRKINLNGLLVECRRSALSLAIPCASLKRLPEVRKLSIELHRTSLTSSTNYNPSRAV